MGSEGGAGPSIPRAGTTKALLLAALICAGVAAVAIPGLMLRDMMTRPTPTTAATLQTAASGSPVDVVVEAIGAVRAGSFSARLLEADPDGSYRATAASLTIARIGSAHFEMGSLADIRAGAIVAVRGTRAARVSGTAAVDAVRIVVLTGFATLR